jgi:hypothetical protein
MYIRPLECARRHAILIPKGVQVLFRMEMASYWLVPKELDSRYSKTGIMVRPPSREGQSKRNFVLGIVSMPSQRPKMRTPKCKTIRYVCPFLPVVSRCCYYKDASTPTQRAHHVNISFDTSFHTLGFPSWSEFLSRDCRINGFMIATRKR